MAPTAGLDFGTVTTTLVFAPNETSKPVDVPLNADSAAEALETFTLNLSTPTNSTVHDGAATGTIVDPGGPIGVAVDNPTALEGTGSALTLSFTLTLSTAPAAGQTVSVKVATSNGTAIAGTDYTAVPGPRPLSRSTGETSKTVAVTLSGDSTFETNETLNLTLSTPVGVVIADTTGVGTIVNDD